MCFLIKGMTFGKCGNVIPTDTAKFLVAVREECVTEYAHRWVDKIEERIYDRFDDLQGITDVCATARCVRSCMEK
jgi:hypothetical protein